MYSNLQQQALVELGIQVLDIRQQTAQETTGLSDKSIPVSKVETDPTTMADSRPSLSSFLNPSAKPNSLESIELISWSQVDVNFINDLRVIIPSVKVVGEKLQLTTDFTWQMTSEENVIELTKKTITTSFVGSLSIDMKRQVWEILGREFDIPK